MTTESTYTNLLKVKTDLQTQIDELQRDVEAVDRLLKRHIPAPTNGHKVQVASTASYQPIGNLPPGLLVDKAEDATTWKQKIIYIISLLKAAHADEVGKKIYDLKWAE